MTKYPKYYVPVGETWTKSLVLLRLNNYRGNMTSFYKPYGKKNKRWKKSWIRKYIKNQKIRRIPECEAALLI